MSSKDIYLRSKHVRKSLKHGKDKNFADECEVLKLNARKHANYLKVVTVNNVEKRNCLSFPQSTGYRLISL